MKKVLDKYAWSRLLIGIVVLLLGAALIVVSIVCNAGEITKIFGFILGACFALAGVVGLIGSLAVEHKGETLVNIVPAGVCVGVGVALIV